ncbi:MAG: insulinase family protein [Acidobacteriia bacterium]|nr:insulinase family protein [Terriglobia bacterium]
MTKRKMTCAIALALSLSLSAATAQQSPSAGSSAPTPQWKKIPVPPLHAFHPQEPRRVELPNGLVILLQEDHELPLIDGTLRIRGGSRDEPAAKAGMMDIYPDAWRTGGTKTKTGDQLDDFLEMKAARVEASSGLESVSLSWSSLKEDFDQVLGVVMDLLQHPEFRQDKIDLAKEQMFGAIARRNDELGDIVRRESARLGYGADSPYARIPEFATVAAVTREDLMEWHKRTVAPNNMLIGISGDFDSAAMERKLREAFGALPKGRPFERTEVVLHDPAPGIYFAEKADVNQSGIALLHLGIDRHNPDYFAVVVMNELFGGGISSRLFSNVRTKEGLAYSVGGGVGSSFDHPGLFLISMSTRSGNTGKAIDALNREIAALLKNGVTQEELQKAKDSILNSFIFTFDSNEKVLAERMTYEFYGYPADFLEKYRTAVEKVTTADVARVARKYIHPEKIAVLVVGHAAEFDRDLGTLGKVKTIDISIPKMGEKGAGR